MDGLVEDLDVAIGLDVGARDLSLTLLLDGEGLDLRTVQLEGDLLEVQNHVRCVLDDALDR